MTNQTIQSSDAPRRPSTNKHSVVHLQPQMPSGNGKKKASFFGWWGTPQNKRGKRKQSTGQLGNCASKCRVDRHADARLHLLVGVPKMSRRHASNRTGSEHRRATSGYNYRFVPLWICVLCVFGVLFGETNQTPTSVFGLSTNLSCLNHAHNLSGFLESP